MSKRNADPRIEDAAAVDRDDGLWSRHADDDIGEPGSGEGAHTNTGADTELRPPEGRIGSPASERFARQPYRSPYRQRKGES